MTAISRDSSSPTQCSRPGARPRSRGDGDHAPHHHGARTLGGRRLLPTLASAAFATALLAGCGAADTEEPGEDPGTEQAEQSTATDDSAKPTEEESPAEDRDTDSDDAEVDAEGEAGGESLFEGSWGFGHDTKSLEAGDLAELLEEEAESRGPEEMSLGVECADGVDTATADYTAECTAYADEGVEHAWLVTVGPADSGLEIEVENAS